MGMAIILADQTYSLLHDVAKSNCQNKVVMDIRDGPSRREIARDLGLEREQEEFLAELSYKQENRRAVVQLYHYPYPFLMKIPNLEKPEPLTPDQLKERRLRAISEMKWKPLRRQTSVGNHRKYDSTLISHACCSQDSLLHSFISHQAAIAAVE